MPPILFKEEESKNQRQI